MGFLKQFLKYNKICIQCHNNPDADAVASSYALSRYLSDNGVKTHIIYAGSLPIKKSALKMMIKECDINISYAETTDDADLLLYADCQRANGNVQKIDAKEIAIIDHHINVSEESDLFLIKNHQSCSTLVWELLKEEGYEIDYKLSVALLFGLYTDTAGYADLYAPTDLQMRTELYNKQPLFERLTKSNMSVAELLIAGDALLNHYLDIERSFAIIEALKCDQTILGSIGDIIICVDVIALTFTYCETADGYPISLRSSHETIKASDVAKFVCQDIGSGGGHPSKAGGYISKEKIKQKYGDIKIFDLINMLISRFIDEQV